MGIEGFKGLVFFFFLHFIDSEPVSSVSISVVEILKYIQSLLYFEFKKSDFLCEISGV